jgi:hypothetical protein
MVSFGEQVADDQDPRAVGVALLGHLSEAQVGLHPRLVSPRADR